MEEDEVSYTNRFLKIMVWFCLVMGIVMLVAVIQSSARDYHYVQRAFDARHNEPLSPDLRDCSFAEHTLVCTRDGQSVRKLYEPAVFGSCELLSRPFDDPQKLYISCDGRTSI